jgi:hypothetical protein
MVEKINTDIMKTTAWIFALIVVFFCSCNGKKENSTTEYFELKEETLPFRVTCSKMSQDTLPLLPNELVSQLLRDMKNYQGNKMNMLTPIPEEWAVECKLISMSSDFDIWIITNTGEPTYKFLATVTTTQGDPSIIQSIPVAYNAGLEKTNFIESEQWTANIQDDYTVTVTKLYEKLFSLTDPLTPANESIHIKKEDVYSIESNGRINYKIPPSFNIDYRTIIQFADTAITGNILDEQWLWNSIEIQEVVEPVGILFGIATTRFDKLSIYNYHGEEIDIVDISSFLSKHNMGFLAIKKGEKPLFIPYSSSKECLQKAFKYFEMEYDFQESDTETSEEENEVSI